MTDYKLSRRQHVILAAIAAWAIYGAVACCVFAYRHPWMTDTQRSLHILDALLWRRVAP